MGIALQLEVGDSGIGVVLAVGPVEVAVGKSTVVGGAVGRVVLPVLGILEVLDHTGKEAVLYHQFPGRSKVLRRGVLVVLDDETEGESGKYRVEHSQLGVAAQVHGSLEVGVGIAAVHAGFVGVIVRINHGTEHRDVGEYARGVRLDGSGVAAVVRFETVGGRLVTDFRVAYGCQELQTARETVVGIEVVVPGTQSYQVLAVDVTAEPLVRVIARVGNLYIIDRRTAADRPEGDGVDFVVDRVLDTGKLATYILQHTRVVGIVVTAVFAAYAALDGLLALVVLGFTQEDDTAPVARFTAARSLSRREDDRTLFRALGNEFAAPLYNQGSLGFFLTLDNHTRLDGEGSPLGYIYEPAQVIGIGIGQSHVRRNLIGIGTIAQVVARTGRNNGFVVILITTYYGHGWQTYEGNRFE